MTDVRGEVFASATAKMVLRDRWVEQTLHRHRPIELIVALDGPIAMQCGDGLIERSCTFLVPPMRQHALSRYEGRVARIYLDAGYRRLTAWKNVPIRSGLDVDGGLRAAVERFFVSRRGGEDAGSLMNAWLRAWLDEDSMGPPSDRRVAAILAYLDGQDSPARVDRRGLSRLVSLSPTRLAAIFAEDTGTSLSRYLVWRRVKIALTLICAGRTSTHAAAEAGFSDSAHLTRSCRATYGCTPSSVAGFQIIPVRHDAFGRPPIPGKHLCLAPHGLDAVG